MEIDTLIRELSRYVAELDIRSRTDREATIHYLRRDTERACRAKYPEWCYGSIWVTLKGVEAGDTVVPLPKKESVMENLKRVGCRIEYVHEYPDYNVAHIHVNCAGADILKVARALAL